mmetsp:Transcript_11062/g.26225  ORF Transcript_11062/g.26225 Transcript_11062/m.26225 type:complete len:238 (+) Transcript_11062:217-930(+)
MPQRRTDGLMAMGDKSEKGRQGRRGAPFPSPRGRTYPRRGGTALERGRGGRAGGARLFAGERRPQLPRPGAASAASASSRAGAAASLGRGGRRPPALPPRSRPPMPRGSVPAGRGTRSGAAMPARRGEPRAEGQGDRLVSLAQTVAQQPSSGGGAPPSKWALLLLGRNTGSAEGGKSRTLREVAALCALPHVREAFASLPYTRHGLLGHHTNIHPPQADPVQLSSHGFQGDAAGTTQ